MKGPRATSAMGEWNEILVSENIFFVAVVNFMRLAAVCENKNDMRLKCYNGASRPHNILTIGILTHSHSGH